MTEGNQYDADYYLRGKESGKSLYQDYRWLESLTLPMAETIITHLSLLNATVLDFGCARGYLVKALRHYGVKAYGMDCSQWAIDHCDPDVRDFVNCTDKIPDDVDWIIAKDVLEHVPNAADVIEEMMDKACVGVFAVVPLSNMDGFPYVEESYEKDVTHIHRLSLPTWGRFFVRTGWNVELSYRVKGIKDNYAHVAAANGFITARRIFE